MGTNEKPRRKCSDCAACCGGWLKININGLDVDLGKPCQHLATNPNGCGIYDTRPEDPCRKFFCSWAAADSPLPEWMRPDLSKAIVLFNSIEWQGITLDKILPVGEEIPKNTLNWLVEFAKEHQRSAIFSKREVINGTFTRNDKIMVVAPHPIKARIGAWLNAGKSI